MSQESQPVYDTPYLASLKQEAALSKQLCDILIRYVGPRALRPRTSRRPHRSRTGEGGTMTRMCHHTTCVLEWMHAGDHEYESAAAAPSLPAGAGEPGDFFSTHALLAEIHRRSQGALYPRGASVREISDRALFGMVVARAAKWADGVTALEATVATLRSTLDAREQRVTELTDELNTALATNARGNAVAMHRHQRLAEVIGDDPGYSADATLDRAIKLLASREARIGELEKEVERLNSERSA